MWFVVFERLANPAVGALGPSKGRAYSSHPTSIYIWNILLAIKVLLLSTGLTLHQLIESRASINVQFRPIVSVSNTCGWVCRWAQHCAHLCSLYRDAGLRSVTLQQTYFSRFINSRAWDKYSRYWTQGEKHRNSHPWVFLKNGLNCIHSNVTCHQLDWYWLKNPDPKLHSSMFSWGAEDRHIKLE